MVAKETIVRTRIVDGSKFIVILKDKKVQPFTIYKGISAIQQVVI
jgi:hypothetical protein